MAEEDMGGAAGGSEEDDPYQGTNGIKPQLQ